MDGGLTKQTNTIAGLVDVPTAAMVGVPTSHHCRQLIVKKVVGGDTDHGFGTGFVIDFVTSFDIALVTIFGTPSLPTSPPPRSVSAMMITQKNRLDYPSLQFHLYQDKKSNVLCLVSYV
ncbi:hypothetical protein [Sphingobacterium sp. 1.A.5]|uniref:hypothetical protein n=1 Tax=Sphingobacterium sp. 1.A.5 TaxID=2044604 RepID=UPI000C0BC93C|nr:hypothetical protein [Sphingobacterium sp. 1.A.5]